MSECEGVSELGGDSESEAAFSGVGELSAFLRRRWEEDELGACLRDPWLDDKNDLRRILVESWHD